MYIGGISEPFCRPFIVWLIRRVCGFCALDIRAELALRLERGAKPNAEAVGYRGA
jgi:hypothetical protein